VAKLIQASSPQGSSTPVTVASGLAIDLPFTSFVPSAAESNTVFGAANTQQSVQFISNQNITLGHVSVRLTTGLAGALMGVAIYDVTGTIELAKADSFSVAPGVVGPIRIALNKSLTLSESVGYWLSWTCTDNATVAVTNFLMSTQWQGVYNAGIVRSGTSGATSGGACNPTLGAVTSATLRIPLFIFD
jgi:hypothetical protein